MTTLSYVIYGSMKMSVRFACLSDATDAARALTELPGVVNIVVHEDGHKPYAVKKTRYVLHYTKDVLGAIWYKEEFSSLAEAARYGDTFSKFFKIYDRFTGETLYDYDVECFF